MISYRQIDSPLGAMLLRVQDSFLTGVYFEGQKYYPAAALPGVVPERAAGIFDETARQIAAYFDGSLEAFSVPMRLVGTDFQTRVWEALRAIPFGETLSYGDLAGQLGLPPGHARAVGGAVGRNPVSVIVPCHRVLGAAGDLTGYAGGTDRKRALLRIEGHAAAARLPILQQSALAFA